MACLNFADGTPRSLFQILFIQTFRKISHTFCTTTTIILCEHVRSLVTFPLRFQIEKSQGEIYRLRAKLESTQSENENMADELEKMQRALNQSYSDRDRIGSDLDKLRDDLERSQVINE